jgi:hypothetical protein
LDLHNNARIGTACARTYRPAREKERGKGEMGEEREREREREIERQRENYESHERV